MQTLFVSFSSQFDQWVLKNLNWIVAGRRAQLPCLAPRLCRFRSSHLQMMMMMMMILDPPKRMRRNTTFPTRYNTCPPGTLLPRMGKMSLPGPNGAGKHPQELTLPKIGKQSKILPKHPWRSSPAYYGVVKISHTFKHLRICKKIIK